MVVAYCAIMKVLYVTDLHGTRERYRRIEKLAVREEEAAVLNGGDLLPGGPDLHRSQAAFIEEVLYSHMAALGEAGIHFLGILGNDDLGAHDALFEKTCGRVSMTHDLAGGKVERITQLDRGQKSHHVI